MAQEMTITVDRLRIRACHGVFEQERVVGNDYEVSVSLCYPPSLEAARTDDLDATINYAEVIEIIREEMQTSSKLIEHVCGRIQRALQTRFPDIVSGCVTVTKLLPPVAGVRLASVSAKLAF